MTRATWVTLLVLGATLVACGDDGPGGSGGSGAGGSGGAGATGGTGATGGGGTGAGGAAPIPCGDELTCQPTQACIEAQDAPTCTNKEAPDDPCPKGQIDTNCGGDGAPCCCEQPPPSDYACDDANACGGEVSCACLVDPCDAGLECVDTDTQGKVICQAPAMP